MKTIFLPIIMMLSLSLLGCGASSSESNNKALNSPSDNKITEDKFIEPKENLAGITTPISVETPSLGVSTLEGEWSQGCIIDNKRSIKNQIIYEGNSVRIQSTLYSDSLCEIKLSHSLIHASYELGEELEITSEEVVNKITYTVSEAEISFYDAEIISNFNREKLCNSINWQVGISKNISSCNAFKSLWKIDKDILLITNEGLFTGNLSNLNEENFPNQLNNIAFSYREIASLTGGWIRACNSVFENYSNTISYSFSNGSLFRNSEGYQDSNCLIPDYSAVESGTYTIGQERTLDSGITILELTLIIDSINVAYHDPEILDFLNNDGTCGTEPWVAGEPKEVINCVLFNISIEQKDIFIIEDNNLTLGIKSDQMDSFPSQLEATNFLRQ
jgi:hypothetical protein